MIIIYFSAKGNTKVHLVLSDAAALQFQIRAGELPRGPLGWLGSKDINIKRNWVSGFMCCVPCVPSQHSGTGVLLRKELVLVGMDGSNSSYELFPGALSEFGAL